MPTYFLTMIMLLFQPAAQQKTTKWVLSKQCSLKVNGSTNINKFSCIIPSYTSPDTLIFIPNRTKDEVKVAGQMTLEVQKFDCHNAIMTKDLRKTLKADQFPKVTIRFISLSKYPGAGVKNVVGTVMIALAGVSKQFEVNYLRENDGAKNITLIGTKQLSFSDFSITPPRKLGGMIKTNDRLDVEFILKATILN